MFGRLVTDGGLTFDEIRAMTLSDVERLFSHWNKFPPVRILVAAFVGFKPDDPEDGKKYVTTEEARAFMRMTGGKIPGVAPIGVGRG